MTGHIGGPYLSFYDHHRQRYGDQAIKHEAEFMVGDYGRLNEDQGLDWGGEFKIALIKLGWQGELHPHLEVFGDATGSLQAAIAAGLLPLLEPVKDRDEFARRLLSIGLRDRSDRPMEGVARCPHCGWSFTEAEVLDD